MAEQERDEMGRFAGDAASAKSSIDAASKASANARAVEGRSGATSKEKEAAHVAALEAHRAAAGAHDKASRSANAAKYSPGTSKADAGKAGAAYHEHARKTGSHEDMVTHHQKQADMHASTAKRAPLKAWAAKKVG